MWIYSDSTGRHVLFGEAPTSAHPLIGVTSGTPDEPHGRSSVIPQTAALALIHMSVWYLAARSSVYNAVS
jgi:predicted secreted protein